ncbi:phosphatidylserine decarboxylase [bacterium]|nr:phosphatidylserine decarboxylase [candidate division CSSED10-310 bacterium]
MIRFLRYLPLNLLGNLWGTLSRLPLPRVARPLVYSMYSVLTGVDRGEIAGDPRDYRSLADFFLRPLPKGARSIATDPDALISPVDGAVSELGAIEDDRLIQAKGLTYRLDDLIGRKEWANRFRGGLFITFYLSPKDYHRIHCPCDGIVRAAEKIPGRLFTVQPWAVNRMPELYSRNERITSFLETARGAVAVVKVGAAMVGGIRLSYDDLRGNTMNGRYEFREYEAGYTMRKGEELGAFAFGSTVIMLLETGRGRLGTLHPGDSVRMGGEVARWI